MRECAAGQSSPANSSGERQGMFPFSVSPDGSPPHRAGRKDGQHHWSPPVRGCPRLAPTHPRDGSALPAPAGLCPNSGTRRRHGGSGPAPAGLVPSPPSPSPKASGGPRTRGVDVCRAPARPRAAAGPRQRAGRGAAVGPGRSAESCGQNRRISVSAELPAAASARWGRYLPV